MAASCLDSDITTATSGYLTEREADGVNVINWYHRQFIDVCKERYFRNLNFLSEIHSNIAEYFMGKWSDIQVRRVLPACCLSAH